MNDIKKYFPLCFIILLLTGCYVLFKPILFPFVLGFLMAYFLSPSVQRLENKKIPKPLAVSLVLIGFLLLMLLCFLIFIPFLEIEIAEIIVRIPTVLPQFLEKLDTYWKSLKENLPFAPSFDFPSLIKEQTNSILSFGSNFIVSLLKKGVVLFNVLSLLVIAPIVAFYMMLEWPVITKHILSLIPTGYQQKAISFQQEINEILRGFVKGQSLVCLFLGLFYGIGFLAVGLPNGLMTGILAGFLSFIPYVGSLFAFFMSLLLVFIHNDPLYMYVTVMGIVFVGQFIEGNFLTPKLVGGKVGLSPVWVMFALLAAGSLFGFVGLIVATPVSAIIGLIVRKSVSFYQKSDFYLGEKG